MEKGRLLQNKNMNKAIQGSRKSFQDSTIRFLSLVESHLRRQSYPLL